MFNEKECSYFKELPKLIQESIAQSGTKFSNEEELREFVCNLETGGNN